MVTELLCFDFGSGYMNRCDNIVKKHIHTHIQMSTSKMDEIRIRLMG